VPVFSCGGSLYIDWRMVMVVGGNVLHHVKEGGGIVLAGECPGEYVKGEMFYTQGEVALRGSLKSGIVLC